MNKSRSGFTIVELLIVIVVIGILAAITIVAYRGIQQRATTAAITSAVDQWEKILRMEIATSGDLPLTASYGGAVCLGNGGTNFPQTPKLSQNQCITTNLGETYSYNSAYFSTWATKANLPSGQLPNTAYAGANFNADARGIILVSYGNNNSFIEWIPQVAGQCGRGELATPSDNPGSLTGGVCILALQ